MENQLAAANNDMNGVCGYSHVTEATLAAPLLLVTYFVPHGHLHSCIAK